jgi:hypothetical protein
MIDDCVAGQGKGLIDKNYAIDALLADWLREKVVQADDPARLTLMETGTIEEPLDTSLPRRLENLPAGLAKVALRSTPAIILEEQLPEIVAAGNFFDIRANPRGRFVNALIDNGDRLTVTDLRTGIMWQRAGSDITNLRRVRENIKDLNLRRFAGYADWRLPTMEEAFSLLDPEVNGKGLHLHPCFSREQPFVFLADERKPGGYWFMDFKQATVFWASGTIPGGFARVCRSVK